MLPLGSQRIRPELRRRLLLARRLPGLRLVAATRPVCANCFPPLDSMIAAPKAVGLGRGADSVLREQEVANDVASTATTKVPIVWKWRVISWRPPVWLRLFARSGMPSERAHLRQSCRGSALRSPDAEPVDFSSTGRPTRR